MKQVNGNDTQIIQSNRFNYSIKEETTGDGEAQQDGNDSIDKSGLNKPDDFGG